MLEWLFSDVTDTINVAELIWTGLGLFGAVVCLLLFVGRIRTTLDLYVGGINGSTRLLSWLRTFRAAALGTVFMLISAIGIEAMQIPTNPATVPTDPVSAIPPVAILLIEVLLFTKAVVEEIIEVALANMHGVQNAAEAGRTPPLGR